MATFDYSHKKPSSSDRATGLTTNLSGYRKSPPPRAVSPIQGAPSENTSIQPQSDRAAPNGLPHWAPNLIWNPQRYGVQPKLTIGQPDDQYEQEADRVASEVVNQINTPQPPQIQRMDNLEDEELQAKPLNNSIAPEIQRADDLEEEDLQMKPVQRVGVAGGMDASPDLESAIAQARGAGQPLDPSVREPIEQAMRADFSGVRVHTDTQADQLNRSVQARAFTTGQDVFFRQGEYNPGSRGGQELIAHELTHVVQQNGGAVQRMKAEEIELSQIFSNRVPEALAGEMSRYKDAAKNVGTDNPEMAAYILSYSEDSKAFTEQIKTGQRFLWIYDIHGQLKIGSPEQNQHSVVAGGEKVFAAGTGQLVTTEKWEAYKAGNHLREQARRCEEAAKEAETEGRKEDRDRLYEQAKEYLEMSKQCPTDDPGDAGKSNEVELDFESGHYKPSTDAWSATERAWQKTGFKINRSQRGGHT